MARSGCIPVTNARIALSAGTVLGALLGLGVVVVVWNAVEHLNEWGDDHMGAACAIQLGSVLAGAILGGTVGQFMTRSRSR